MRLFNYLFIGLALSLATTAQPTIVEAQENGESLLDEAVELKLDASGPRDLDKVADLCEEAIEKGLEDESLATAKQLWASVCFEHAKLLAQTVFTPRPDRRWKFQRQQALERLEKAVELVPEMTDAWLMIAQFNLLDGGDKDAAKAAVDKALEQSGDAPDQQVQSLILRARTTDDEEQRKADIDKALEIEPNNVGGLAFRGQINLKEEKYDEAIEDFSALARAQDNIPLALVQMAEQLRADDKDELALKAITRAIEINPDIPESYSLRSTLYLSMNKDEEALADAGKAIELNPRDIAAIRSRAGVYYSKEKYEEALKDVEKILMLQDVDPQALYMRSFIYAGMEDYEPAIEDMKSLIAMAPGETLFRTGLASLYSSAGEPEKAIEILDGMIKEDPDDGSVWRSRGDVRLSSGEHQQAVEDYEKALTLDESDDGVLNNLAWVLATSTYDEVRDGKRAVVLALKAAEMSEYKEAHILSTLAAAYAEVGDFENAVKWSEKSVELASEGRQAEDLAKELETLKAGNPIRENEAEEAEKNKSEEEGAETSEDEEDEDDSDGEDDGESDKDDDGADGDDGLSQQ